MKKLLNYANEYIRNMDWKAVAILKLCLCSLGVIVGVLLPDSAKIYALVIAGVVFVPAYIYLMVHFFMDMRKTNLCFKG